jgi:hypothetical protein
MLVVTIVLGVVLLVPAALAWATARPSLAHSDERQVRPAGIGAASGLGAGIMAVEPATFGAVTAIVGSRASLPGLGVVSEPARPCALS